MRRAPQAPTFDRRKYPTDPDSIIWLILFFAPAAVIGLAINWRKYEKPGWMWNMLMVYLLLVGMFVLGIVLLVRYRVFDLPPLFVVISIILVAHYFLPYVSRNLQKQAYKYWMRNNTFEGHRYNFSSAFLGGFLMLLVIVALTLVLDFVREYPAAQSAPTQRGQARLFTHDEARIYVPTTWGSAALPQNGTCRNRERFECIVAFTTCDSNCTYALIGRRPRLGLGAAWYEADTRSTFFANNPGYGFIAVEEMMIANREAVMRLYTTPTSGSGAKGSGFGMNVFVYSDNWAYEIIISNPSPAAFVDSGDEIDALLSGIEFIGGVGVRARHCPACNPSDTQA